MNDHRYYLTGIINIHGVDQYYQCLNITLSEWLRVCVTDQKVEGSRPSTPSYRCYVLDPLCSRGAMSWLTLLSDPQFLTSYGIWRKAFDSSVIYMWHVWLPLHQVWCHYKISSVTDLQFFLRGPSSQLLVVRGAWTPFLLSMSCLVIYLNFSFSFLQKATLIQQWILFLCSYAWMAFIKVV